MMRATLRTRAILALAAWLLGTASVPAETPTIQSETVRNNHVAATLIPEVTAIEPGKPFYIGLRLEMDSGWNTYWKNPGDAGLPTKVEWSLPPGFTAHSIEWPAPHRIAVESLVSFGYEDSILLLTRIDPPADLAPGTKVRIAGRASWLACEVACVPGSARLEVEIPVASGPADVATQAAELFAATRKALPSDAPAPISMQVEDGSLLLRLPDAATASAWFFPADNEAVDIHAQQRLETSDAGSLLSVPLLHGAKTGAPIAGVLVVARPGDAPQAWRIASAPSGRLTGASPAPARVALGRIVLAALLAFAGGLILNLMPCVLPVLSLKVLGFVRHAGSSRRATLAHGGAFALGVVVSFWVLAGLLMVLRAAGQELGWGFQLQSPIFTATLAAVFLLLSLNLLGVFEVGLSMMGLAGRLRGRWQGLESSFGDGVLATAVASPCTAPFMGTALGFALTQPAAVSLFVFTALGLGLAAPYVVLSAFPALIRWMPKPGAWMDTFKKLLAFPLLATVIWLVWVFGHQTGINSMALLLCAFLAVALAAFIYGRWMGPPHSDRAVFIARLCAIFVLFAGVALGFAAAGSSPARAASSAEMASEAGWQPFSEERLTALLAEGKPVFVDFTAAWCITCQWNKKAALEVDSVRQRFAEVGVVKLRADWTSRDPAITRALERFGRNSVPLYLLYGGKPDAPPAVLPQLLTPQIVLDALAEMRAMQPLRNDDLVVRELRRETAASLAPKCRPIAARFSPSCRKTSRAPWSSNRPRLGRF